MKKKSFCSSPSRALKAILVMGLAIALAGCASTPKPIAVIAGAEAAVQSAQSDDASQFAPIAMDRAEEKLRRANDAMNRKDYAEARRLADEARADAEFAQAETVKVQTQESVQQLQTGIEILRDEIKRGQND